MLDTRLLEVAQKKDKPRADAAWGILQELIEIAGIPG